MATARLDNDDVSKTEVIDSLGRNQMTNIVSEMGLYDLIIRSDKPEAREFKRWITHEVIPSIRKTGSYSMNVPQTYAEALRELAATWEENQKLLPKAAFFDAVADSKTAIDIGQTAKVLNMGIGRNSLFDLLRNKEILMQDNLPYQRFIDYGYFRTVEQKYTKPDGSTCISIKTLVYQKVLDYIRKVVERAKVQS
jgi:phage antirepressor YoqD-like protein